MRITNQNEYYAAISKLRSLSHVVEPDCGEFAPGPDTSELEQAINDYRKLPCFQKLKGNWISLAVGKGEK